MLRQALFLLSSLLSFAKEVFFSHDAAGLYCALSYAIVKTEKAVIGFCSHARDMSFFLVGVLFVLVFVVLIVSQLSRTC